jgi:hypothetical protein
MVKSFIFQWKHFCGNFSFSGGNFHFLVETFLSGNYHSGNYLVVGSSKNEITGNYSTSHAKGSQKPLLILIAI